MAFLDHKDVVAIQRVPSCNETSRVRTSDDFTVPRESNRRNSSGSRNVLLRASLQLRSSAATALRMISARVCLAKERSSRGQAEQKHAQIARNLHFRF